MEKGHLYVFIYPGSPQPIKVGKTTRTVAERLREISSQTAAPVDLVCVLQWEVTNVHVVERLAHAKLARHRNKKRKEWFDISVEAAKPILDALCWEYSHEAYRRAVEREAAKAKAAAEQQAAREEAQRWLDAVSNLEVATIALALQQGRTPPAWVDDVLLLARAVLSTAEPNLMQRALLVVGMLATAGAAPELEDHPGWDELARATSTASSVETLAKLREAGLDLFAAVSGEFLFQQAYRAAAARLGSASGHETDRRLAYLAVVGADADIKGQGEGYVADFLERCAEGRSGPARDADVARYVALLLHLGAGTTGPSRRGRSAFVIAESRGWKATSRQLPIPPTHFLRRALVTGGVAYLGGALATCALSSLSLWNAPAGAVETPNHAQLARRSEAAPPRAETTWYCLCYQWESPEGLTPATACRTTMEQCQSLQSRVEANHGLLRGTTAECMMVGTGSHPADLLGSRDVWAPSAFAGSFWVPSECVR